MRCRLAAGLTGYMLYVANVFVCARLSQKGRVMFRSGIVSYVHKLI